MAVPAPEFRVSVIIPAYNRAAFLPATLNSVLAQTHPAAEIMVVDDGSTDDTAAVLKPFLSETVTLLHQANAGVNAARNAGAARATSTLLLFLDADDLLVPDALERLTEALTTHPKAALAFGGARKIDNDEAFLSPNGPEFPAAPVTWETLIQGNTIAAPGCVLLSAHALQEVGGWEARLRHSEDWDLWLRLAERFPCIAVPGEPTLHYRVHGTNVSADAVKMHHGALLVLRRQVAHGKVQNNPERLHLAQQIYWAYVGHCLRTAWAGWRAGNRAAALALVLDLAPRELIPYLLRISPMPPRHG